MAAFHYRAVTLNGKEVSGVAEGDSPRQVKTQLRGNGLFVTELVSVAEQAKTSSGRRGKLSQNGLALLTRQWATLLDAGLPIERVLVALQEQTDDPKARKIIAGVRSEVVAGMPLYRALESFEGTFPPLYRALVEAGEHSGQLGLVMLRLADALESSHAMRQKVIQASVYPILIVVVAILVVGLLMFHVVPQVVSVFQSGKQTLPLLTRMMIITSDFFRVGWPYMLGIGVAVAWVWRWALKNEGFRFRFHEWLIRLPALGRLLLSLDSARLAQTLAILVNSGVPLLTSLAAGRNVIWLLPLKQVVAEAQMQVSEGATLHRALSVGKRFPSLLLHMIGSGEASGQLGPMLEKAARQQQNEVSNRLTITMGLIEPVLILAMGAIVLVIVLAIMQPILQINQIIR